MCYWSLVRGVWPDYEVVEFQPWTVTPPKPWLCSLLLHSYSWPAPPSPPAVRCHSGRASPLLPRHPLHQRQSCLRTGSSVHLYLSQHTDTPMPIPQDTLFLTRKQQLHGDCKIFEAACREQALVKATKTKAKRNKKLKIAEAALKQFWRTKFLDKC